MRRYLPLVIALLVPLTAAAQLGSSIGGLDPFTLTVDPQYPAPGTTAKVSILPNSIDPSNATMVASVNGKEVYRGNARPLTVTLGKAGTATRVSVTITSTGKSSTQTVSIVPQDVALVVEPAASVPPLYLGKALVPSGGGSRIVAVANLRDANGRAIDPASLSYSWNVDDTQINDSSGIGRSALMVASPLAYRARTVSVAVASQDGTLAGGDSVSLNPQDPIVRIYENDPLLGIRFDRALGGNYAITGAESTLYAAPFSLPTTSGAPLLQWFLNSAPAQTGNVITLRPSGSGEGTAALSVTAAASDQSASGNADLTVTFGAAKSSFLGL